MPSTMTHAYFIMDIYDKLPIKRKDFLKNQKESLKTFAQSVDPLYFYTNHNIKKFKIIRNFPHTFHTQKTQEFIKWTN